MNDKELQKKQKEIEEDFQRKIDNAPSLSDALYWDAALKAARKANKK